MSFILLQAYLLIIYQKKPLNTDLACYNTGEQWMDPLGEFCPSYKCPTNPFAYFPNISTNVTTETHYKLKPFEEDDNCEREGKITINNETWYLKNNPFSIHAVYRSICVAYSSSFKEDHFGDVCLPPRFFSETSTGKIFVGTKEIKFLPLWKVLSTRESSRALAIFILSSQVFLGLHDGDYGFDTEKNRTIILDIEGVSLDSKTLQASVFKTLDTLILTRVFRELSPDIILEVINVVNNITTKVLQMKNEFQYLDGITQQHIIQNKALFGKLLERDSEIIGYGIDSEKSLDELIKLLEKKTCSELFIDGYKTRNKLYIETLTRFIKEGTFDYMNGSNFLEEMLGKEQEKYYKKIKKEIQKGPDEYKKDMK